MSAGQSWGRFPAASQRVIQLHDRFARIVSDTQPWLPRGNGRSYGDSCLNDGGTLVQTLALDRFIAFDPSTGILRCEAGVLLGDVLALVVPQGWFLPVTPGTQYVTVGGAIANDVHGKNHHYAGSFGDHVLSFELLRSDGVRRECSPARNGEWFDATVGGLGLTGMITWAELQLRRIAGPWLNTETLKFRSLQEFFDLSEASAKDHEYTVAWVDCVATGTDLGRGLFMRGNHASALPETIPPSPRPGWRFPIMPPTSLVNPLSLRMFNFAYWHRQRASRTHATVHYTPYFYPLDRIRDWNRIYGPRGFLQYQCVLPPEAAAEGLTEIMRAISASGTGSFLAVLKQFGGRRGRGLLSFPRPGTTLALDFPNDGAPILALLDKLDDVVMGNGGAVYPAKDARMSARAFKQYFPTWESMHEFIDPHVSSSFWRRVSES